MFENSSDIQLLRVPRQPRRYLIFIRAGSKPRPSFFFDMPERNRGYDLAVNYYAAPHPNDALKDNAEIIFAGGLSKMHAAKKLFGETKLHETYEGVFFLDDDIEILFDPDLFFKFCEDNTLDIAQPALTPDCTDAIGLTRQHPGLKFRTTNWVEVMAPFFRHGFLKEMLHSFDMSISGWGLDLYWGHHLTDRWTAGIIDEFLMRHTQVSNHATGAFYSYLRSIGVDPYKEMRSVLAKIGTNSYTAKPIRFVYHTYSFSA